MKRRYYLTAFSIALLALVAAGCGKSAGSSGTTPSTSTANANTASTPATPMNTNAATSTDAASTNKPAAEPPALVGTYTISEVEHKGVVTMIPPANTTQITFYTDGTFFRASKKNGRQDFTDNGQFRIEKPNRLILVIQLSRGKIQLPPVEKAHDFTLSADGEELRLKGKDGKTALFRRTARPNGQG